LKKISILAGLILLFALLDNTFVPFFAIYGYYPSLLLSFLICYSIVSGSWEGVWLALAAGILQDIYFQDVFGVNVLANLIVALLAGQFGKNLFKEKKTIPIISTLFFSFIKGLLVFVILYLVKVRFSFDKVLYSSIYTFMISIFMYPRVYSLCQRRYMIRKWKF